MGEIMKRKKKGRPSKADLARRNTNTNTNTTSVAKQRDLRRSIRRRNVRYTLDFDDYIDYFEDEDEDEDDYDDDVRREKKLDILLKPQPAHSPPTPTASPSSSANFDAPLRKRKIDAQQNDIDDDEDEVGVRGRKPQQTRVNSVPATPPDSSSGIPLPDKRVLELILDKLQKKDIYGVYADPVDPEELPDYFDVIKHPMDFTTIRKKLGNGKYSTLEQFESDVFLICANAMQYNAPDTIYYKQAFSIEDQAKRKFQGLRMDVERSEKEVKTEQKTSNSLAEKLTMKSMSRTIQEPVGSDFSSGATLATAGDFQNGSSAVQTGGCERPTNVEGIVQGNSSLIDSNLDKGEELLRGKGPIPRLGKKPPVHDENRRATYNMCNQPISTTESIFTTFEDESKHLVPVGLHTDHSYATSLARFAATLGSVAWKVASQRIEQALPLESKFGRGWVGEYEPLPTPVLMVERRSMEEPSLFTRSQCTVDRGEDDKTSRSSISTAEHPVSGPTLEGKASFFGHLGTSLATSSSTSSLITAKEDTVRGVSLDGKPFSFCSPGTRPKKFVSANYEQQSSQSKKFVEIERKMLKDTESNCPSSANQSTQSNFVASRQISNGSELPDSRSMEAVSRNRNLLQSVSFKQSNIDGVVGGLPNGKALSNGLDRNRVVTSSPESFTNPLARAATYSPQTQEHGLSDPVQLMRMLAEKAQNQHKSSNNSIQTVVVPPVPSLRREDVSNAANSAGNAWMSIGAGGFKPGVENTSTHKNQISPDSLYNPTRDRQPQMTRFRGEFPVSGMQFQPDNNSSPLHAFVSQPVRMGNEAQFQNRPVVFPQLVRADLSRFQVQSPWHGLNQQTHPRQKQESFPPDLNIGFPSSGSPVRQSSGVIVDSQQPDLALQL